MRLREEQGLPQLIELFLQQAHNLMQIARLDDALALLERSRELCEETGQPVNPKIPEIRGVVLKEQGRPQEALACFSEAEQLYISRGLPVHHSIFFNRGSTFESLGRLDDALQAYDEAARLSLEQGTPVWPGLTSNRGNIFLLRGQYDEALAAYDTAEQQFNAMGASASPQFPVNRGLIHFRLGRYEEALAANREAERLCIEQGLPVHHSITNSLGIILGKLGHYEEALAEYARGEQLASETGMAESWLLYFWRAITMYEAGHRDEAIREVYKAIALCGKIGAEQPAFLIETLQDWMSPKPEQLVAEQIASQQDAVAPVPDSEKKHDVFICYRRGPAHTHSMLLQAHMEFKGKTVFRDQDGLHSGRFEDGLKQAIRYSRHMVVILTPEFFARCTDGKDVVRQEIATALHHGTHIIPVMMEGFSWPAEDELPEDIRAVCSINAMSHSSEFYTAFIDKLLRWME